jgi:hypothetical protein
MYDIVLRICVGGLPVAAVSYVRLFLLQRDGGDGLRDRVIPA